MKSTHAACFVRVGIQHGSEAKSSNKPRGRAGSVHRLTGPGIFYPDNCAKNIAGEEKSLKFLPGCDITEFGIVMRGVASQQHS